MAIFGVVLGIFELIALAGFLILFCLGAAFDRKGYESFKWWVFFGAIVVFAALNLSSITFAGIWEALTSASMWKSIGFYALLGLGYSIIEFFLHVRKTARATAATWGEFIKRKDSWSFFPGSEVAPEELASRVEGGTLKATYGEMFKYGNAHQRNGVLNSFAGYTRAGSSLIKISSTENGEAVPVVDRGELASYIGAWTTFWPFYAISLILGDLLEEVWNTLASILAKISGRFVRMAFADVFKV